jgi:predicted phosphoribosyltransferase
MRHQDKAHTGLLGGSVAAAAVMGLTAAGGALAVVLVPVAPPRVVVVLAVRVSMSISNLYMVWRRMTSWWRR